MKCDKCGEEVVVQPGKSANFCSNCGNKIEAEKASDWKYFDNTKDLLAHIAAEYGLDALFSKKYLSDHAAPSLPQGHKRLVSEAFSCDAVKILQNNINADQKNKEIAVKQAVKRLTDLMFSQEAAERVIWEFTHAIGWKMVEPTIGTPIPSQQPQPQLRIAPPAQSSAPGVGALMTRAWQFAEDGDWKDAADYFNKVLDTDPSYAPAFLGLLCVDLKASKEDKLAYVEKPTDITGHKYYKRAVTDPAIKAQLDGYVQVINARIDAKQKAAAAELDRVLAPLREKFDPKANAEKQAKLQEQLKVDKECLDAENAKTKADADAKCLQIQQKFDADHNVWQDEYNRLKKAYDTEYKKWETEAKAVKAQAESRKLQGLCPHCGGLLKGLLSKKCTDCGKAPSEPIKTSTMPTQPNYPAEPKMPQMPIFTPRTLDESKYKLKEDKTSVINQRITLAGIEWRILNEQDGKLLLISDKILEKRHYNIEQNDITWENCTLRKYLNGEFLNKLVAIKPAIAETRNNNPNNQWFGTAGGNSTIDKVFLLSLDEVCCYFGDSTANLNKKGSTGSDFYINDKNNTARIANNRSERTSSWWLRSPGHDSRLAALVRNDGCVYLNGQYVRVPGSRGDAIACGVRPALWLDL